MTHPWDAGNKTLTPACFAPTSCVHKKLQTVLAAEWMCSTEPWVPHDQNVHGLKASRDTTKQSFETVLLLVWLHAERMCLKHWAL